MPAILPSLRAWILAALATLLPCSPVLAADVKVISAMALHATLLELMPLYEKASGDTVTLVFSPGLQVASRIRMGERADLAVLAAAGVDELIKQGILAPGSRTPLADSLIAIATRPNAPRPDLSTAASFKASLLATKSIALSAGTSSLYLRKLFQDMGIANELAAKLYRPADGRAENVASVLRRGDADVGFQQLSELIDEPGIVVIGPIPPEVQEVTVWSAGLYQDAPASEHAKALIRFLTSPQAAPVFRKHGLAPR